MRNWLVVLCILCLPLASAGTADDPEITDPGDDASSRPDMDLQAAWFEALEPEDADPVVRFSFQLSGDPQHAPAFFAAHEELRLNFVTETMPDGVAEIYVSMRPSCTSTDVVVTAAPTCQEDTASCRVGFAAEAGGYQALEAETAITGVLAQGDLAYCEATYAQLQMAEGASILDPYATHRLVVRGPLASGDAVGPEVIETFDRAPDEGFGRAFQIPAPAPEAAPITYATIDALPFLNETTEATSGVVQFNLTSEEALRFLGEVEEGSLAVNITLGNHEASDGPGTEPVFTWNGTDGFDHTMEASPVCVDQEIKPVPCRYAIQVTMTDFVGMIGVDVATEHGHSEATPDGDGDEGHDHAGEGNTTGDGNESVQQAPDDQESPGPALPLLAAVLAALVWVRRRS